MQIVIIVSTFYIITLFILHAVDCVWSEWVIGVCSNECGGGHQLDFRTEIQEELFDGKPCTGEGIRILDCNSHNCPSMNLTKNVI